ncbi:MAG TPA: FlgD immunoglobulin-like domain containing protein, partial [Tahibacter sp.]|nr:FlgD immunoglobulin-like domain containing protein [Tahibacter sp.]
EILLERGGGSETDVFDARTSTIRPFRDLPLDDRVLTPAPLGVVVSTRWSQRTAYFAPRDTARPIVELEPETAPGSTTRYATSLSPDRSRALLHARLPLRETLTLVDFATGARRVLVDRPNDAFASPLLDGVGSVRELAVDWIASGSEIAVVDGRARRLLRFDADGAQLDDIALPPVERTGPYALDAIYAFAHAFATTATPHQPDGCVSMPEALRIERPAYDPVGDSLFVHLVERVGMRRVVGEEYTLYLDGASQFVDVGLASRDVRRVGAGSPLAFELPADAVRYPLLSTSCPESRPAGWPELILRDGARLLSTGQAFSVSRGVSAQPLARSVQAIFPDENRALVDGALVTSLLNGYALIQAQQVGTSIRLTGIAADANFAYYEIDYARTDVPDTWHALVPPTAGEVTLDEFLTWLPPDPGVYDVRLRVVDRAGNVSTSTTRVTSGRRSPIDGFAMSTRWLSPNGDGMFDTLDVYFRVRDPVSLVLRVADVDGNVVRSIEASYGSGDLGSQALQWDGRNDGGAVVADGPYRVTVGDLGAIVVVDTTPPVVVADVTDAYRTTGAYDLVRDGQIVSQPGYVDRELPGMGINVDKALSTHVDVTAVRAADGTTLPLCSGDGDRCDVVRIAPDVYATASYRIVATDAAGNRTTRELARQPERLALVGFSGSHHDGERVTYEALPFDDRRDIAMLPPLLLDEVSPRVDLLALPALSSLRALGVQVRPTGQPDASWVESALAPPRAYACGRPTCEPLVAVELSSLSLVRGVDYQVRLVGERDDGSRAISNKIAVRFGGLGMPVCVKDDSGKQFVHVNEFDAGTPREVSFVFYPPAVPADGPYPAQRIGETLADREIPLPLYGQPMEAFSVDADGLEHASRRGVGCAAGAQLSIEYRARVAPVVQDRCDGEPSGRLRVSGSVEPEPGVVFASPLFVRWRYVDGETLQPVVREPVRVVDGGLRDADLAFELDVSRWPEGAY